MTFAGFADQVPIAALENPMQEVKKRDKNEDSETITNYKFSFLNSLI
jgi:hypothetical protein